MATRARIGLELKDGSILSAYHHWDGYPEWLGRILKTHYNTKEKVSELIDGGDMSCCWTDDRWVPYGSYKDDEYGPQYYSDRGEDCPPRLDTDLNEYLCNSEEYSYVFTRDSNWVCYTNDRLLPHVVKEVEIHSAPLHV